MCAYDLDKLFRNSGVLLNAILQHFLSVFSVFLATNKTQNLLYKFILVLTPYYFQVLAEQGSFLLKIIFPIELTGSFLTLLRLLELSDLTSKFLIPHIYI